MTVSTPRGRTQHATTGPHRVLSHRHDARCTTCPRRPLRPTSVPRWAQRPQRLVLPPGTYGRVPAWRSRAHWLDVVLPAAVIRGRGVLRSHHIAPDTFVRIMAAHAQHADDDTGRGCTPTVEHIQTLAKCSERTVQRARAAARELRIGVEVFRGRHLTLDERIEAYEAGRTHRGWTSVYALGCPRWLVRHLGLPLSSGYPQVKGARVHRSVDRGTPPVGRSTTKSSYLKKNYSSAHNAEQRAPRAASRRRTRQIERKNRFNPAAMALAAELQARIRTLASVHPGRLAPSLCRFALAPQPWTAAELHTVLERVLKVRGWTWLSTPDHPAAYLARLLREIDHIDQPSAEQANAAPRAAGQGAHTQSRSLHREERGNHDAVIVQLRVQQAAELAEREGRNLCIHGVGGADPVTGAAARCAFCRNGV